MKFKKIILLSFIIIICISIFPMMYYSVEATNIISLSAINPDDYMPNIQTSTKLDNIGNNIADNIQIIGSAASVIALMIIGIVYMIGSTEDKASYKETMFPYILGIFFVFGISRIIGIVRNVGASISNSATSITDIGNIIVNVVGTIGSIISVVVLVVIGIKYMVGSIEEKATYKKSLMPYVIGAVLLFAATNIASIIYNLVI